MLLNSPADLRGTGVVVDEPVPDLFTAGAETRAYKHNWISTMRSKYIRKYLTLYPAALSCL
jgi:hypothetical protein